MNLNEYTSEEIIREINKRKNEELRQEIIEMIETLDGGLEDMRKLVMSAIRKKKISSGKRA